MQLFPPLCLSLTSSTSKDVPIFDHPQLRVLLHRRWDLPSSLTSVAISSSRTDIGAAEAGDLFVCLDCCFLFANLSWFNLGLKGWLGLRFHGWVFHGAFLVGFS